MVKTVNINLTVRDPTFPVAPATNARFSSFKSTPFGIASNVSELNFVVPCGNFQCQLRIGLESIKQGPFSITAQKETKRSLSSHEDKYLNEDVVRVVGINHSIPVL